MEKKVVLHSQKMSEFKKRLAELGLNKKPEFSTNANTLKKNEQLTWSEERAWMLHQQDPLAASGPFTAAYQLSGEVDIAKLVKALKQVYQGDSNLKQIYKLNEQGELIKQQLDVNSIQIGVIPLDTDAKIINFLLQQQNSAIDLASQPAIQFWVFHKTDNQLVLGILGHHILLDDSCWQPIFSAVSALYQNQALPQTATFTTVQPPVVNVEKSEQYWQKHHPQGFSQAPMPALLINPAPQLTTIAHLGSQNIIQQPVKAHRFYTNQPLTKAKSLAKSAQASPFQALLTLFGLYLNQLFASEAIDILLPVVSQKIVTQLNQIGSSSNVLPVTIKMPDSDISSAIKDLRNQLLEGLEHNLPIEHIFSATKTRRNNTPNILVTQVSDASVHLKLPGVNVTPMSIPPLASDYDITLAVQFIADEQVRLELTTGQTLSTNIGAFLLEQFIIFIHTADADTKPNFPSLLAGAHAQTTLISSFVPSQSGTTDPSIVDAILTEFKVVLARQDIRANDDFFELGGHSLLATRVIGKLKTQHKIDVKIADFFNAPRACELANYARHCAQQFAPLSTIAQDEELIAPLSLLQSTYMEIAELGQNPVFNIPFVLKLSKPLDEQLFKQAFLQAIIRHHALRSLFLIKQGEAIQQRIIAAASLEDYRWFFPSSLQAQQSAEQVLKQEAAYRFDLTRELPVRVRFVYDQQGQQYLSMLIYHSAFDEWSTGILMQDLFYAYKQLLAGKPISWDKPATQFHQYALEKNQHPTTEQHLKFWHTYLGKVTPAKPLFYQASAPTATSPEGDWIEFAFERAVPTALAKLAQTNKSSMFHVIHAAISLALYYLGAGEQLLVGTSAYGREDARYQDTVGLFTNVIMHHVNFAEELSVNQLVSQVKNDIIASLPYSDVPFGIVEQEVAAAPMASMFDNLCEVYIQFHQKNILNSAIDLGNNNQIDFELLEPERDIAKFGLHFEAFEDPASEQQALRVVLTYRTSHYSSAQITLIKNTVDAVVRNLASNIEHPELTLRDLRKALAGVCL